MANKTEKYYTLRATFESLKGKPYNLFLDDKRKIQDVTWVALPEGYWITARHYNEFVNLIETFGLPEFIAFDHDLADEHYKIGGKSGFQKFDYKEISEKTGKCCADWLVAYCLDNKVPLPNWVSHTMNPCGARNIDGLLKGFLDFQKKEGIIRECIKEKDV